MHPHDTLLLLLPVLLGGVALGYPDYQTAIPNGNRVPHPCAEGQAWLGVGHVSPAGGGGRNPFGLDFAKHGMKWTETLCRADSDGDGRSNGEELGDPQCTWREGLTPAPDTTITHPGICQPLTSPACIKANRWLKCTPGRFECDAFRDKDLQNMTLRLPPSPVPAEVTTYSCMLFRLPDDVSTHLVATQPLLNNTRVVHHMLLFGCRDDDSLEESTAPYSCEMVPHARCQEVIVTWTIGIQGDCLHQHAGFRLGKHGYKMVALQVHWNNPDRAPDFTDSSGLVIHFTPNLRKYDAGILVFGHLYLQIDPLDGNNGAGTTAYSSNSSSSSNSVSPGLQTYTSTCPQHCMREMFNGTIYITTAINHMHYLGKTQVMELMRGGTKVQDIAWDRTYDYDSPVAHRLDPPIEVRPGDAIRTTCTFRRPASGKPVCYGEATSDEMCFGFLTYFPLQKTLLQPWCTSRRGLISCERTLPALWDRPIDGCAWRAFIRPPSAEAQDMVKKVLGACYPQPGQPPVCSSPCRAELTRTRQHPCFRGDDMAYYMLAKLRQLSPLGDAFAAAFFTCNCHRRYDFCERRKTSTSAATGLVGAAAAAATDDAETESGFQARKEASCAGGWTGAITDGGVSSGSARRSPGAALNAVVITCLVVTWSRASGLICRVL